MIVSLIVVALAMGITDVLGTLLVVAEARGRARLAGSLDALSDVSRIVYTADGVSAITHGINGRTMATLAVICSTSFVATSTTTSWARRLKEQKVPDPKRRRR